METVGKPKTLDEINAEKRGERHAEVTAGITEYVNSLNLKLNGVKEIDEEEKKLIANLLERWKESYLEDAAFALLDKYPRIG